MQMKERKQVIELLRRAGDVLEATDGQVLFPDWEEPLTADEKGIRIAAEAIQGRLADPDEGTRVHVRDLGFLVGYIADMLEE